MDNDALIELCAIAAHEVNRMYCFSHGDTSHKAWNDAPEDLKVSVRNGVRHVLDGKFPTELHKLWMDEKLTNGWRYGPVKNYEKKEHPCLLEFAALPEVDRKKDVLFFQIVISMATALGLLPGTKASE